MSLKLIYDIDSKPEFEVSETLNEATGEKQKKYKIKGVFSTIGEKNRNGRTYPRELWMNEVSGYQENITNGTLNTLMEWEHPARTEVDPMEAVAKIEKLSIDGKYVMGEAVLLDNPKANQIKSLIDNGIKISVSSRALGKVTNGVVDAFKLITYDLVSTPSDYNATMNGLVESYQLNEGVIEELAFGLDKNGNIIKVPLNECADTFNETEVSNAILSKFDEILGSLKL